MILTEVDVTGHGGGEAGPQGKRAKSVTSKSARVTSERPADSEKPWVATSTE
jgi:hypothetical protein